MYYVIRAMQPRDAITAAAQFIYLNKTCYNGLYRVNSTGQFNVPYGRPKSANVISSENLVECARVLAREVTLLCDDFERAVHGAKSEDLVYFDPPYVTGHSNNGFVEYNEVLFNWTDQERLAKLARRLSDEGIHVMISNADHHAVLDLYKGFRVMRIRNHSSMAGASASRGRVTEVIIHKHESGDPIQ